MEKSETTGTHEEPNIYQQKRDTEKSSDKEVRADRQNGFKITPIVIDRILGGRLEQVWTSRRLCEEGLLQCECPGPQDGNRRNPSVLLLVLCPPKEVPRRGSLEKENSKKP